MTAAPHEVQDPRPAPDAAGDDWRTAWAAALDAVELDVQTAEELVRSLHQGVDELPPSPPAQDWVAPSLLGPVPAEFAERARRLLQRQVDVSERLAEAVVHARSQRRALGRFERPEQPPVFVDKAL
ncbi:hypothetical protein [Kineococcus indalonis]|uniref:hypothetical protein n=1 Tax=Kineococcus indalonis TaxID=2696566 RepID=UPI001412A9DB|nr:hypothetical protein [Kineococcus indalonis]NAZ86322.1 hypothetical protein [Kineococcus indalonis]